MHILQSGGVSSHAKTLAGLRLALARIASAHGQGAPVGSAAIFALGVADLDDFLGGGLSRAALHEIHAPQGGDWSAAVGFGLALALRAAPRRPLFWARPDFLDGEAGRLNGVGLAEYGVDPALLTLVLGRDAEAVLRAGVEAARCKSLGAALIEIYGDPRALDLTATLRLARAAEKSGVTLFLLRIEPTQTQTGPPTSAALSRWLSAGASFSRPGRQCAGRARLLRNLAAPSRRRGRSSVAFGVAA